MTFKGLLNLIQRFLRCLTKKNSDKDLGVSTGKRAYSSDLNDHKEDFLRITISKSPHFDRIGTQPGSADTIMNCRVCGLDQGDNPWGECGQFPSFDICGCCGVQFGYEDCTELGMREFRQKWLENGAKWFMPKDKPEEWSLEEQMKGIPDQFK